jgi:hypothetical protein
MERGKVNKRNGDGNGEGRMWRRSEKQKLRG